MHNAARQKGRFIVMKSILKNLLGLAVASVAATAVLSFTAFAAAESANSTNDEYNKFEFKAGMWQGKFLTYDVDKYANFFIQPTSFDFYVKGRSLTLTSNTEYVDNKKIPYDDKFKTLVLTIKSYDGIVSDNLNENHHNYSKVTVTSSYTGYATIHRGEYYGFMYNGKDISSGMHEKAGVHVIHQAFINESVPDLAE